MKPNKIDIKNGQIKESPKSSGRKKNKNKKNKTPKTQKNKMKFFPTEVQRDSHRTPFNNFNSDILTSRKRTLFSKKTNNSGVILDRTPNFFKRLFFLQHNQLFKRKTDADKIIKKLSPLSRDNHMNQLTEIFHEKRKVFVNKQHDQELIRPILLIVWKKIMIAIILGTCRILLEYSLTLFIREYLSNLKIESYISTIIFVLIIIISFFIIALLREHALNYTKQASAKASQIMRGIFFEKLKIANYRFLNDADGSFISNVLYFEIENIINLVSIIPQMATTPISFFLSFFFVYLNVGDSVWASVILFEMLLCCKILLQIRRVTLRSKYYSINSKRAVILTKLTQDIKDIKVHTAEYIFIKKLNIVRHQEQQTMR